MSDDTPETKTAPKTAKEKAREFRRAAYLRMKEATKDKRREFYLKAKAKNKERLDAKKAALKEAKKKEKQETGERRDQELIQVVSGNVPPKLRLVKPLDPE